MSLHTRAGGFEAINIPRTQEERIHARRTAISRLVDNNAYLFGIYPELHRLLPDPMGSMISKRAWETHLFVIRTVLRHLDDNARNMAHNFVLRHYEQLLRRRPELRDALPDPAEDSLSDQEWGEALVDAVQLIIWAA